MIWNVGPLCRASTLSLRSCWQVPCRVSRCVPLARQAVATRGSQAGSTLLKYTAAVASYCGAKLLTHGRVAHCQVHRDTPGVAAVTVHLGDVCEPSFDWRRFLAYLRPHAWLLLAAIAGAFVVALLNIEIPRLVGGVVNVVARMVRSGDGASFADEMREPVKRLLAMYSLQAAFTFVYIYLLSCVGERVAASMRQDLFSAIMRQDISFFDRQRTGEIINRLTTDVQDFKSSFKLCISQGLRSITQIVGCAVSLFVISPDMTWAMLTFMPAIIIVGTIVGSFLRTMSRRAQEQASVATWVSEEAVSNVRTVRAFAMEAKECEAFDQQIEESRRLNERLGLGIGLFQPVYAETVRQMVQGSCWLSVFLCVTCALWAQAGTNLFLNGMVLGTLWAGGRLLSTGHVSAGDLMAFLVAAQTIQRSLAQASLLLGQVVRGLGAGARIFQFINLQPSMPLTGGKVIPYHSLAADVEFKNVTFAYPTRSEQVVLKNFNLRLPPGKTVAVVGTSGNGKSTIAALLERFYDVDEGSITVDGMDIRTLDPSWLRGRVIGFINQEPVLFATTVMENIRYGRPAATDREVVEAARIANADEFIRGFPEGYDTQLGERGATVSGGQRQRIAIARALLKRPSILILDEATSALDAESEKLVQDALDEVSRGRTVLVIAHRLSTVQGADIIVVLNNGVIVEMGDHEELKKKQGFYWNLIRQQELGNNSLYS